MARIPDETREAIADELREGKASVRAIATKYGVGPSTVSRIAAQIDVQPAARPGLENARVALAADYVATKARIKAQLAADTERLQQRLWSPVTFGKFGGKDNDWSEVTMVPPPDIQRDIWVSLGIAIDKMAVLDRSEAAETQGQATGGLLERLVDSLEDRKAARETEPAL